MILKEWNDFHKSPRYNKWIFYSLVVLCCAIYAGVLTTYSMPPTEGWYSYYAYLVNEEGAVPYLDFELLFPPLYTYIIALFTRIFGYHIMALRILGVVLYALTGGFAFLIFEKLTKKPFFSFLAGLMTVAILQSEVVQIFYDYIRFMDLAVYASIFFLLCAIEKIEDGKRLSFFDPMLMLGAVSAVMASMFKQSSGLIFFLFCCAFFVFAGIVMPKRRAYWKALGGILSVFAVLYGAMFLFLASKGAFSAYWHDNFAAAMGAKGGSLGKVLFGWMSRVVPFLLAGLIGTVLIAALLLFFGWLSRKAPQKEGKSYLHPAVWSGLFLGVWILLFVAFSQSFEFWRSLLLGSPMMFTAFIVSMVSFAVVSVWLIVQRIRKKEPPAKVSKFCFFFGAVFILAYSVCTSGGLAESQIALGFPLIIMLFLPVLRFRRSQWIALALSVLMFLQTGFGWERKIRHVYEWWNLSVGPIESMTETVDLPMLAGIRMSKSYADMYTGVVRGVQAHTGENEEIFVFPHMPVLYLLCDRPRATFTANQWFDVSIDASVVADIEVIRQKKPKAMVICMIDDYVIESHESSFRVGTRSGLHEMQLFLGDFVRNEEYILESSFPISDGYTVEVWYLP